MVSSEVQRTLVKSRPELWAELSDPATLARHLGELGEIRITKTKPEERVEWEAGRISGSVSMKASGWGTKVTLSVTHEIDEVGQATEEPAGETLDEPGEALEESAREAAEDPETQVSEESPEQALAMRVGEPDDSVAAERPPTEAEAETIAMPTNETQPPPEPAAEQRRGFFSRLFRRRAQPAADVAPPAAEAEAADGPAPEAAGDLVLDPRIAQAPPVAPAPASAIDSLQARFQPEPTPLAAEPVPVASALEEPPQASDEQPRIGGGEPSRAADEASAQTAADVSAELKAAEEVTAEEVTAVLTAVLDRLGAAHHRPFSRS